VLPVVATNFENLNDDSLIVVVMGDIENQWWHIENQYGNNEIFKVIQ